MTFCLKILQLRTKEKVYNYNHWWIAARSLWWIVGGTFSSSLGLSHQKGKHMYTASLPVSSTNSPQIGTAPPSPDPTHSASIVEVVGSELQVVQARRHQKGSKDTRARTNCPSTTLSIFGLFPILILLALLFLMLLHIRHF